MRLAVDSMPDTLRQRGCDVGDVFRNQRGALMVVVACHADGGVSLLMFNEGGGITGVNRYAQHYLREKALIGRVVNLPDELEVEWGDGA